MALFSLFGAACAVKPAAVSAVIEPGLICSPVSGRVVDLAEVDDDVFAQGMLGEGLAIEPEEDVVYAPVSGMVAADVKTKHALLIRSDDGLEVLIHAGIDTVRLGGDGFVSYAAKGDRVAAGEPVLEFDRALARERGLSDTVVVTVTNSDRTGGVERACGTKVVAGQPLLRAGK